ncbi:MAG TPA: M23 family metallopeptidase [Xanthobacteraceae bacterium]|nr:M23 family metallopeptidase [Xanthobacteraceae bacterium]
MPRRSSAQHHHRNHSRRPQGAAAPRWAGLSLVHAGRQLRIGPIAFWVVVGTLVIMAGWTISTATYFAFREDVLTRLIARQAEMQFGYEDRIAELRAQVDRFSSRQLLDQEQYEQKLDQILRRQTALESRASALNGLGDMTGAIKPPARGAWTGEPRAIPLKPSHDKGAFVLPFDRATSDPRNGILAKGAGGIGGVIARLQASLDRLEQRQTAMVNSIADNYDSKARRMRGVLIELGLDGGKTATRDGAGAMGGPFIPAQVPKDAMSFERQLHRIQVTRAQITRLTRTLGAVPVRKPIDSELDLQSGFGVRIDPFLGRPAMHTGLDLHGETGDVVRATADGTVTAAGWSGGYGRAVDVDHGNGLSTRYGHLSSIDVRVGQSIKTGQIIGKVGSTGRSTGPHLHYETRLKGEAVDPQKFLRAGQRLAGSL